jgi:hypothetical protein
MRFTAAADADLYFCIGGPPLGYQFPPQIEVTEAWDGTRKLEEKIISETVCVTTCFTGGG